MKNVLLLIILLLFSSTVYATDILVGGDISTNYYYLISHDRDSLEGINRFYVPHSLLDLSYSGRDSTARLALNGSTLLNGNNSVQSIVRFAYWEYTYDDLFGVKAGIQDSFYQEWEFNNRRYGFVEFDPIYDGGDNLLQYGLSRAGAEDDMYFSKLGVKLRFTPLDQFNIFAGAYNTVAGQAQDRRKFLSLGTTFRLEFIDDLSFLVYAAGQDQGNDDPEKAYMIGMGTAYTKDELNAGLKFSYAGITGDDTPSLYRLKTWANYKFYEDFFLSAQFAMPIYVPGNDDFPTTMDMFITAAVGSELTRDISAAMVFSYSNDEITEDTEESSITIGVNSTIKF